MSEDESSRRWIHPRLLQTIANFLPLTYAADAMRKVMVIGADVSTIASDVVILAVFGSILLTIAMPMFNMAMAR